MSQQGKLSDDDKIGIVERHVLGESQCALAKEFKVSQTTISKVIKRAGKSRPPAKPTTSIVEFAKRARSILWRQDGKEKGTYKRWEELVEGFKAGGGMNPHQAIVQASKDFPCLKQLFREYNVGANDPHPESHPDIQHFGQPNLMGSVENEGRPLGHRENLAWAIDTAGKTLRTGEEPTSCPNDAAYYLYRQACDDPKDFFGKFTQVDIRGGDEGEEQRLARKSGKRSIEDINKMLESLVETEHE